MSISTPLTGAPPMHRRDLLRLLGATALLPCVPREAEAVLRLGRRAHAAARAAGRRALSEDEARVVTVIAEMIIPRTDTPGASDVDVTGFVDLLLTDWYSPADRTDFLTGIRALVTEGFADLSEDQRIARLTALDSTEGDTGSAEHAVRTLKALTIYGYFTAERVVKEVTRDPVIPGRFDGCVRF